MIDNASGGVLGDMILHREHLNIGSSRIWGEFGPQTKLGLNHR